jgi:hypothetical protein
VWFGNYHFHKGQAVTDIVKRLQDAAPLIDGGLVTAHLCRDAANEITRLRAALSKYADPNYNGFNGGPEHARAALTAEDKS